MGDAMVPDYCTGLALQPLPDDIDEWQAGGDKRQVRSRCNRAEREGYIFVDDLQPRRFSHDIVDINRSMPERQGRPMAAHYTDPAWRSAVIKAPVCPLHHTYWYGVLRHGILRAYASWHRCGELLQTNIWIGHGDFLGDGIMYFMMRESLRAQREVGPGWAMYAHYDAGGIAWNGGGLRQWKKQLGFEKMNAVWV